MSAILVTLTSRSDSNFERSNISLKKINQMVLSRALTVSTTPFKEKIYCFRQTVEASKFVKLVLRDAIFLATCSARLEKSIANRHVTRCNLGLRAATCNGVKNLCNRCKKWSRA